MIKTIQSEFKEILKETSWMDEASRRAAVEKADFIVSNIGYPDFIYNETFLAEEYQSYQFPSSAGFLANGLLVAKETATHISHLRENIDRNAYLLFFCKFILIQLLILWFKND